MGNKFPDPEVEECNRIIVTDKQEIHWDVGLSGMLRIVIVSKDEDPQLDETEMLFVTEGAAIRLHAALEGYLTKHRGLSV